jgi:Fur family peroxide stress response transcriptional regulator
VIITCNTAFCRISTYCAARWLSDMPGFFYQQHKFLNKNNYLYRIIIDFNSMNNFLREKLQEKGLKVTPQRVVIYDAIVKLNNHPTAENIIAYIKENHPNISVGTVYKVLDSLVENELLKKVKTEKDIMRYDAVLSNHHHLYCAETDRIEDYEDDKLNKLINDYFKKNSIKNFKVQDIKLQITGKFNTNTKKK